MPMNQLASEQLSSETPLIDPFENHSKGVFYNGGNYQQILDQLLHFVQFGSDPVIVFGESGAGKTALCRMLSEQVDSSFASVAANASLDVDALMAQACVQWQVPPPSQRGRAAMVAAIEKYCIEEDVQVLPLCVDDAHLLNTDSAEILLEICSLLPVVPLMFCVEGEVLSGLRDKSVELEIAPLTRDELVHYLAYRFDSAGLPGDSFDEKEIGQLYDVSGGVPGLVVDAARSLLIKKQTQEKTAMAGTLPMMHIAVLVVLAVVLMFLWLAAPTEKVPVEKVKIPDVAEEVIEKEEVAQAKIEAYDVVEEVEGQGFDLDTLKSLERESLDFKDEIPEDDTIEGEVPSKVAVIEEGIESSVDVVQDTSGEAVYGQENDVDAIGQVIDGLSREQEQSKEPEQESLLRASALDGPGERDEVVEAGLSDRDLDSMAFGELGLEVKAVTADVAWLQRQDNEQFTLQLMGAGEEVSLRRLVRRYFERPLYVLQTTRAGNPWYILVHGVYADNASARSAIEKLPVELKVSAPWPKKFVDIKGRLEF